MLDLVFRVTWRVAFRLFMVGLVLLLAAPAFAQGEALPVEDGLLLGWWQVFLMVAGSFLGGAVTMFAAVGSLAQRLRGDMVIMSFIERLADSIPPATLQPIIEVSTAVKELVHLIEEATDGIPAASKPPEETRPVEPVG